jgi:hypothetical protein
MREVKQYKKTAGTVFSAIAGFAALVAMVCCIITSYQQGDFDYYMVILLAAGALIDFAVILIPSAWLFPMLGAAATGAGFMILLVGRLNKIGLILNNVVEEAIPTLFLVAAGCVLFAMFLNCLTAFVGVRKQVEVKPVQVAATSEEQKAE